MNNISNIINLKDFSKIRNSLGSIVCASGGFDPIHPGHTNYIIDSKRFAKVLVVIVNGDDFLFQKKGYSVMNLEDRCMVVASIKNVDYVIPYEVKNDLTVIEALKIIKPQFFTKGGDRNSKNTIPEWEICKELNIEIKLQIGIKKRWSSTSLINNIIKKISNKT